jgi:lipopolysaccharide/colanic/teichoic acid biosynthesis glycosyltransferase
MQFLIVPSAQHPSTHSIFKRFIDIIGSLVGVVGLVIVVIPIAIAIKFNSPGPIFYCQRRCGWNGELFTLYKFRTVFHHADCLVVGMGIAGGNR